MKKIVFYIISVLAIKSYAMEHTKKYCIVTNNTDFEISLITGNKSTSLKPLQTTAFEHAEKSTHIMVYDAPIDTEPDVRDFTCDSFPSDLGVIKQGTYALEGVQADKVLLKRLEESSSKVDK